jgi:hypothetical protein
MAAAANDAATGNAPASEGRTTASATAADTSAGASITSATLAAGLQTSREQYDQAHAHWTATRKGLDRQLARHRKALKELVVSQATAKRGSPTWQALAQAIREADTTITQLERERTAVAPRALPGLSSDQAAALAAFAAEVRLGLSAVTAPERQEVLRLLGWEGTVYDDPQGVACGRHAVRIEWTSRVPLPGAQCCITGIAS